MCKLMHDGDVEGQPALADLCLLQGVGYGNVARGEDCRLGDQAKSTPRWDVVFGKHAKGRAGGAIGMSDYKQMLVPYDAMVVKPMQKRVERFGIHSIGHCLRGSVHCVVHCKSDRILFRQFCSNFIPNTV